MKGGTKGEHKKEKNFVSPALDVRLMTALQVLQVLQVPEFFFSKSNSLLPVASTAGLRSREHGEKPQLCWGGAQYMNHDIISNIFNIANCSLRWNTPSRGRVYLLHTSREKTVAIPNNSNTHTSFGAWSSFCHIHNLPPIRLPIPPWGHNLGFSP